MGHLDGDGDGRVRLHPRRLQALLLRQLLLRLRRNGDGCWLQVHALRMQQQLLLVLAVAQKLHVQLLPRRQAGGEARLQRRVQSTRPRHGGGGPCAELRAGAAAGRQHEGEQGVHTPAVRREVAA